MAVGMRLSAHRIGFNGSTVGFHRKTFLFGMGMVVVCVYRSVGVGMRSAGGRMVCVFRAIGMRARVLTV
jgi:hypothetical protein